MTDEPQNLEIEPAVIALGVAYAMCIVACIGWLA
jgi:hypothetical protein